MTVSDAPLRAASSICFLEEFLNSAVTGVLFIALFVDSPFVNARTANRSIVAT